MGGGGGGPAARPRLRHPLLVAGRGLASRAPPAPLWAGPVHPRRRLPHPDCRLRWRGRHRDAPRSGHLRLALGLAGSAGSPPPAESQQERDYRQRSRRLRSRCPDRLSVIDRISLKGEHKEVT